MAAVFLSKYGRDLNNPRAWFELALEEAKVKNFRWHDLRHTFISRLVMKDVNLRTVQELAGHKTISMTTRYAHLAPEHNQAAIEKLDPAVCVKSANQLRPFALLGTVSLIP